MPTIVYQDAHLVVLDKPSGLLAVPGRGPHLQDCASARIQAHFPDALIVHRLDRDTSGLMVMARGPSAQRALSRQFESRTVEKAYITVVHGRPSDDEGRIELPLRKDFDRPPRHKIDPIAGRPAITDWHVLERENDRSRLLVRPITGRSHQIRVHLAAIGHPILGDPLYAPDEIIALAPRLLLHASELALDHSTTGERIRWTSACPF